MMTQDRGTYGVPTSTSPRNLNPTAPAFHQSQATPSSQNNLNPSAPVFQHSPTGEKSPSDIMYSGTEAGRQGLLANGDISANGTNYSMHVGGNGAYMLRDTSPHQIQGQGLQNPMPMGLTLTPLTVLTTSTTANHQSVITAVTSHQQNAYAVNVQEKVGNQQIQKQVRASNQISPHLSNGESYENPANVNPGGDEEASKNAGNGAELGGASSGQEYPEEVLAPIRKQMQFYFSNENLPNDKFLNQHMDLDKFIPLELFLDFGRIKPICNNIDLLTKAVETSSILELSEDRKRVRVSQCRKTLTLRGFPQYTTEEDVRQFILEMGEYVPTHIEFVMCKEKYSVWYVSFKDETAALNSFFQFHQKAVYKGHTIGCCIKSSGTLAAAGYFPSTEESNQRRSAYQNQVAAVTAPVHAVQNTIPQPQPQQPQALMQPFSTMQLHPYLPASPTNIFYQQTPQGSYMPYMTGMLHGWPAPTAAMEPGLIMQSSGLQPQHIRASMPRAHIMSAAGNTTQNRFGRPQRTRQNNLERSASERSSDRPPVVSVSGPSRSSPYNVESSAAITAVSQGAYMPRRTTVHEDMMSSVISQAQVVSHQLVTPLVAQQQHHAVTTTAAPTAIVNPPGREHMALHYQPSPHQHHRQQHAVMVQTAMAGTASAPPPPTPQINNPPPSTQHMHPHHSQPPPSVPQQQQHHHHQQAQIPHHHQQQQTSHPGQHSSQHHQLNQQLPPPPTQLHHHQQPSHPHQTQQSNHHQQHHHPHHQHSMVSPYHQHHSQQHHHQYLPPQVYHHQHQQSPPGNRSEKRNRRKREDNVKNPRAERSQSNRANFSAQTPTAADNFTMEANSFPPLPGALNSLTNSEVSHESRMSDIVRGVSRNPSLGSSNVPRASSTTPSPVATPGPMPITLGPASGLHHELPGSVIVDAHSIDNGDLVLDDDVTSSSQEEVDTDITFESRSVRSEQQSLSSAAEPLMLPSQSSALSQSMITPVTSPATVLAQRQIDNHQGSVPAQAEYRGPHRSTYSHQQASPTNVSAEAPKLSYAQILAQKNREAANNAGSVENTSSGGQTPNYISGTSNGSNLTQNGNTAATVGANQTSSQTTNAFREHGNYQGGQQHGPRSSHRGPSKDNISRSDGPPPSSRQPNGSRRNSKENRTSNKYDRRKPDSCQK